MIAIKTDSEAAREGWAFCHEAGWQNSQPPIANLECVTAETAENAEQIKTETMEMRMKIRSS